MPTQQINQNSELIKHFLFYFRDNWLALAAFAISVITLLITWANNVKNRRHSNDKELLELLKNSLELAYNSIAIERGNDPFPTNNRLSWLTSARHIVRYRQLREFLKTKLYVTLCDEQEEYWRNRTYKLLGHIQDSGFFQCINPDENEEETIEPRSAAIIYSFSTWKEGMPDPIESMSFEQIISKYKLFSPINRHFQNYVESKYPNLAEKAKKYSKPVASPDPKGR